MPDPAPWSLLHDGTVVEVARDGADAVVWIEVEYVRARLPGPGGRIGLRLGGVRALDWLPYRAAWDDPEVTDPAAIAAAAPEVGQAVERDGAVLIWGAEGRLRAAYDTLAIELDDGTPVTLDELRAVVQAYWEAWKASPEVPALHPKIREALSAPWTPALLDDLIEAWREARTSDLADAIEIVGDGVDDLGSRLRALAARARATFLQDMEAARGVEIPYDDYAAEIGGLWKDITAEVAALRGAAPDPRIGRGLLRMLGSPSDHWFRVDQVAHVAGPFEAPDDTPSFADHLLAMLEAHADAGSPARLDEEARLVSIECDCNGAEMASSLRALAETLRGRVGADRPLPPEVAQALRIRKV